MAVVKSRQTLLYFLVFVHNVSGRGMLKIDVRLPVLPADVGDFSTGGVEREEGMELFRCRELSETKGAAQRQAEYR